VVNSDRRLDQNFRTRVTFLCSSRMGRGGHSPTSEENLVSKRIPSKL